MRKITICENPLEPSTYEHFEVENVAEFLMRRFPSWPDTARIYLDRVAADTDITPHDEASADALNSRDGHFWIVNYPEGIETVFIVIAIAVAAVSIGISFLLRPHIKNPVQNQQSESPNNGLSNRQNKERPLERIPDIFGTQWSTPDLIAQPYRVFENTKEVEYAYHCIGRGVFEVISVRDDLTPISQIEGSSVEVYGPSTSPNTGDDPQLRIGVAINNPVVNLKPFSSINGQVLIAPNKPVTTEPLIRGPFIVGDTSTTQLWLNFVAVNGCYRITTADGVQHAINVTIRIGLQPLDAQLNPVGGETTVDVVLHGSASEKSLIGVTAKCTLVAPGYTSVRAWRVTNTDLSANTNVSDDVQWRDCFAVSPVGNIHFGNVTTVYSRTLPTASALALKDRKLNMLVTRKIRTGTLGVDDVTFSGVGVLSSTNYFADILFALIDDPFINPSSGAVMNAFEVYTLAAAIATYFGTNYATEFCYTFDDRNTSFEEMWDTVCSAVFCIGIRRGNLLSIVFERETANSIMLFNHRNKLPKSETRTVTFGTITENDGVELNYIDPYSLNFENQDTTVTLYFPADKSAKNPKKVTALGVRNNVQAWMLGWRMYQKLLFQNTAVQFNATQEAGYVARGQRILVADNTRTGTQDGEVVAQNGLVLNLSQKVVFDGVQTYNIFLQLYDGSVQSIAVTAGDTNHEVVLNSAPALQLVFDDDRYAKTTYMVVGSASSRSDAFLLQESTPQGQGKYELKAVNYDDRYYSHDTDYINNIVIAHSPQSGVPGNPGVGVAGNRYNPYAYDDFGDTATTSPIYAIDTDYNSAAIVSGIEDSSSGVSVLYDGVFQVSGFPHLTFGVAVTLHVWAATSGLGTKEITSNSGSMLSTLATIVKTEYTALIPAGTDIGTIFVQFHATGISPVIDVYEVYIQ